ncbi:MULTISPECIES: hypothetical protein [Marinobacter]|uniref:hypothetical protein n=1 Tax=Marinobacter TaxID=2742 RepID=UPI000DADE5A1|nr:MULTISPECIES: hypothetical protein [Marinobacter]
MSEATLPPVPPTLKRLIFATLGLLVILLLINLPLLTPQAPQGIISLQLAATAEQSAQIVQSWGENSGWAMASLLLDIPFAVIYVLMLLALTRYLMSDRPGIRERQLGRWVRGLFVTAGACDLGENVCLLGNLSEPADAVSLTATLLAMAKFTALMLGVAGLVIVRASRRHPLSH